MGNETDSPLGDLIARVLRGDESAFDRLYSATCQVAFFHAKMILHTRETAEAAVVESYYRARHQLDRLSSPESFPSRLNRTVSHVALSMAEDERYSRAVDPIDEGFSPAEAMAMAKASGVVIAGSAAQVDQEALRRSTARFLVRLIAALPEVQRCTLILYYYDRLSVDMIAQIMGCPPETVKNRLNAARRRIGTAARTVREAGAGLSEVSPRFFLAAISYLVRRTEVSPAMVKETSALLREKLRSGA